MYVAISNKTSDSHLSDVLRGAASAILIRGLGLVAAFAFNVVIGRLLGVEGAGVLLLALTVCTIAAVLARLGLDGVVLRAVSISVARGDAYGTQDTYAASFLLVAVASVFVAAVVFALSEPMAAHLFRSLDVAESLAVLALTIPATALLFLHAEMLRGLHRVASSQSLQNTLVYILAVPGAVILASATSHSVEWSYLISSYLVLVVAVLLWRRVTESHLAPVRFCTIKRLLAQSPPFFVTQVMDLVNLWVGVLLIGVFSSETQTGLFAMAARVAVLGAAALAAVNVLAAPKFAALHQANDLASIEGLAKRTAKFALVVSAPVFLVFGFFGSHVMAIFGDGFRAAGGLLAILAVGHLVNVAAGPVGYLLTMTGHATLQKRATAFGAAVNTGLCLLLIPPLGAVGAAIAMAASLVVQNVLGLVYVRQKFGFWIIPGLAAR